MQHLLRHHVYLPSLLLLWLLIAVTTCQPKQEQREQQDTVTTRTVTDDLGRKVTVPARPQRVLALAPSMTEMLYAIAPDSMIVGRTQHCNFPEQVQQKPVVNVFPLDVEGVLALHPDLVLTVEGMTSLENANKLTEMGIPVYYQQYEKVEDVLKGLTDLGKLLNLDARAKHVTDSLQRELQKITQQPVREPRPRVLAITWQDPIIVYGTNTIFTDNIRLAGGVNAMDSALSNPYPPVSREYLLKLDPDVLVGRSFAEMDTSFFQLYPELKRLQAYRNRRIYKTTGDLMERPSPRVIESVKELNAALK